MRCLSAADPDKTQIYIVFALPLDRGWLLMLPGKMMRSGLGYGIGGSCEGGNTDAKIFANRLV